MACQKLALVSQRFRQEPNKQRVGTCYHWLLTIHHAGSIVCIIAKSLQVVVRQLQESRSSRASLQPT